MAGSKASQTTFETNFKDMTAFGREYLPQKIAVVAPPDSAYAGSTEPQQFTSAEDVGELYGYGSTIHRAALRLFPITGGGAGDIPVLFLPDNLGFDSKLTWQVDMTVQGDATTSPFTLTLHIADTSVDIDIPVGSDVDAILGLVSAEIDLANRNYPISVVGGDVGSIGVSSKSNGQYVKLDLTYDLVGQVSIDITEPTITYADDFSGLNKLNDEWVTLLVVAQNMPTNSGDYTSKIKPIVQWSDNRLNRDVAKPLHAIFASNSITTTAVASLIDGSLKNEKTGVFVSVPGSPTPDFEIAVEVASVMAQRDQRNPQIDYKRLILPSVVAGRKKEQPDFATIKSNVAKGLSSTELDGTTIMLRDVITCNHPTDYATPPFGKVKTNVKYFNVVYNETLLYNSEPFINGVLASDDAIIDDDVSVVTPNYAISAQLSLLEQAMLRGFVDDLDYSVENISAAITAPNTLEVISPFKITGSPDIVDIKNYHSFTVPVGGE